MKINSYQIEAYQDGDIVLGYRLGSPLTTLGFSGINGGASYVQTAILSSSDIFGLVTPLEILPEIEGGEQYYEVTKIIAELTAGSVQYDAASPIECSLDDGDTGSGFALLNQVTINGDSNRYEVVYAGSASGGCRVGSGLTIQMQEPPTVGNGIFKIYVYYSIRTFGQ